MKIRINDDFDLKKIIDSGQCFRPAEIERGTFRFIIGENILNITELGGNVYDVDCTSDDWERVWANYFDFGTEYKKIRLEMVDFAATKPYKDFLLKALEFGAGIRILRQDPFETLISFIISQRKNIPAIRSSIEKICQRFGRRVGDVYLFPRFEDMQSLTEKDLEGLGLAYRKDYILDALLNVSDGFLESLEELSDTELIERLKTIRGVGDKVAKCVALFAYHRINRVPVDVWIKRALEDDFGGENVFDAFGKYGGLLQQYVFYYKRPQS